MFDGTGKRPKRCLRLSVEAVKHGKVLYTSQFTMRYTNRHLMVWQAARQNCKEQYTFAMTMPETWQMLLPHILRYRGHFGIYFGHVGRIYYMMHPSE